ncbi:phenylacetate--CoA ligase family protein [Mycobacterium sp. MMS18-G62]
MKQNDGHPWSAEIWDEVELWSRDQIESFQLTALQRQLDRVARTSQYYKDVFNRAGFNPTDLLSLDSLQQLPLTYKEDYVASIAADPPFGTMRAVEVSDAVRVHFSSGTTGEPKPALHTQNDLDLWADIWARYYYAQGLRRNDVFQCMFNYNWFAGGLGATLGAQRLGALVIPSGAGDTKRQIETIRRYGTRCVVGTPSFMAHIAETASDMGFDIGTSTVDILSIGGEPGASIAATRSRLEDAWKAKAFDCYGSLECSPIGWETHQQLGLQVPEDYIYIEVLHPITKEPVADGERGVLVLTHLNKEASPLVRWWTGDTVMRTRSPAPDGRTHARLVEGVIGRADDMLVIRGVNLFPSAVEEIVRAMPNTTNEYVIVVDQSVEDPKTGFLNSLKVRVERTDDAPEDLAQRLAHELREKLKVRFVVEVLPAGTLPRTVVKAQRVVRE